MTSPWYISYGGLTQCLIQLSPVYLLNFYFWRQINSGQSDLFVFYYFLSKFLESVAFVRCYFSCTIFFLSFQGYNFRSSLAFLKVDHLTFFSKVLDRLNFKYNWKVCLNLNREKKSSLMFVVTSMT